MILPAASIWGNPQEITLLSDTFAELRRLGISPREVVFDGGFQTGPTSEALEELTPDRVLYANGLRASIIS